MKRFDLYGAHNSSLEEVLDAIQHNLDSEFALHDSDYLGGEYFRSASPREEILVQPNSPDDEGYCPEPDFEEWPILVYVNKSERWDEVDHAMSKIEGLKRLRSEEV